MNAYRPESAARLRAGVQRAYSGVAEAPAAEHPFAVGRAFAAGLGYPAEWLDRAPAAALEAFTGVSNVAVSADLPRGAQVLDLGCTLSAAYAAGVSRTGPGWTRSSRRGAWARKGR